MANNNQGVALCDTPSLGLDNEQAPDSRYAGEWQPLHRGPLRAEEHESEDEEAEIEEWSPGTLARHANLLMPITATRQKRFSYFSLIFGRLGCSFESRGVFFFFGVIFLSMKIWSPPSTLHPSPSALWCVIASSASISCALSPSLN